MAESQGANRLFLLDGMALVHRAHFALIRIPRITSNGRRDSHVQHFRALADYQAQTWSQPRRIIAKIDINPQGSNRRFLVTNMPGNPATVYQRVYFKRGDIPESPIGELAVRLQFLIPR